MKKLLLLFGIVLAISLISADSINVEFPLGSEFEAGDPLVFKVNLYDSENKLMDGEVLVEIKDSEKRLTEKTIKSNQLVNLQLNENTASGQGVITAKYLELQPAIEFFYIGSKELAQFELEEDTLKITNVGNTPYSRTIKITIGDTTRDKEISLDIGQSITYKLIAPEGVYNIRVTDGKTSLTRSDVQLTGTGQVIGALDNSAADRSPVTGGISPDENSDEALLSYIKRNTFVYVFVIAIFAAMILLSIERRYRKKIGK